MRIIPKAKPVKIRIKSGDSEHAALESLKNDFNIEDIKVILDGRLSRWLKQQNEDLLAEEVEMFSALDTDEEILAFIKVFFSKELSELEQDINDLEDVAFEWENRFPKNAGYLWTYLIRSDYTRAKNAYDNEVVRNGVLANTDWFNVFYGFMDSTVDHEDPEVIYLAAINMPDKMITINNIEIRQKDLFQISADKGYLPAKKALTELLKAKKEYESDPVKRYENVDQQKFKERIRACVNGWSSNTNVSIANDDERMVKTFLDDCVCIMRDCQLRTDPEKWYKIIDKHQNESLCSRERKYIKARINLATGRALPGKDMMREIKDSYLPAYNYLNGIPNKDTDGNSRNIKLQISFVLKHLFEY